MEQEKALFIVDFLEKENSTLGESLKILKEAEEIIRGASRILSLKKSKTALKDVLKAAKDYSDSGKSPD